MKVEFLEPAYLDYMEAILFYNQQSSGLGDKFISQIDRTISMIKNFPESFELFTDKTRRAVVNIFPFNVIYTVMNDTILVLAIAHQHREPNYWKNR